MTREEAWRSFVEGYDIEVSSEAIENERRLIELEQAALFEAKEPLVLRALQEQLQLTVTEEELEAEVEGLAERNGTSPETVRGFFGDDLSLLAVTSSCGRRLTGRSIT